MQYFIIKILRNITEVIHSYANDPSLYTFLVTNYNITYKIIDSKLLIVYDVIYGHPVPVLTY